MKIVAGWGAMPVSRLISIGTSNPWRYPRWAPSHLAMIIRTTPEVDRMTGEQELWVESSCRIPRECILKHREVIGVQAHRVQDRLQDYPPGKVLSFRLRDNYTLSDLEEDYLSRLVFDQFSKGFYDCPPSSLVTRLIKRLLFKRVPVLLCSEFVQDVLIHLGRSPIANPSRSSPGSFLRQHIQAGILVPEGPVLTVP